MKRYANRNAEQKIQLWYVPRHNWLVIIRPNGRAEYCPSFDQYAGWATVCWRTRNGRRANSGTTALLNGLDYAERHSLAVEFVGFL